MKSKKLRRGSGRVEANSTLLHEATKKEIIDNCLEPVQYWDDWVDYRDGMRDIKNHEWHVRDKKKKLKVRQAKNGRTGTKTVAERCL
jgi:hypothetical protein